MLAVVDDAVRGLSARREQEHIMSRAMSAAVNAHVVVSIDRKKKRCAGDGCGKIRLSVAGAITPRRARKTRGSCALTAVRAIGYAPIYPAVAAVAVLSR